MDPRATNRPKGLLLPEGTVQNRPEDYDWIDKTITYTENNEQVRFTPEDVLVAAARMLRDGRSLDHIMTELDVDRQIVSYRMLERAIRNIGMPLLERRIAKGQEAAESRVLLHKDLFPLRPDEED